MRREINASYFFFLFLYSVAIVLFSQLLYYFSFYSKALYSGVFSICFLIFRSRFVSLVIIMERVLCAPVLTCLICTRDTKDTLTLSNDADRPRWSKDTGQQIEQLSADKCTGLLTEILALPIYRFLWEIIRSKLKQTKENKK